MNKSCNKRSLANSNLLSLIAADIPKLSAVLDAAQRHIHSSSHLFKVAQEAFRYAMPPPPPENPIIMTTLNSPASVVKYPDLLKVAFQLGLQVMRVQEHISAMLIGEIVSHFSDWMCSRPVKYVNTFKCLRIDLNC